MNLDKLKRAADIHRAIEYQNAAISWIKRRQAKGIMGQTAVVVLRQPDPSPDLEVFVPLEMLESVVVSHLDYLMKEAEAL